MEKYDFTSLTKMTSYLKKNKYKKNLIVNIIIVPKINLVILSLPGNIINNFWKFMSNKIRSDELDKNVFTIKGIVLRLKNSRIVKNNKNKNKKINLNLRLGEKTL